jgi:hypothetical protein
MIPRPAHYTAHFSFEKKLSLLSLPSAFTDTELQLSEAYHL